MSVYIPLSHAKFQADMGKLCKERTNWNHLFASFFAGVVFISSLTVWMVVL